MIRFLSPGLLTTIQDLGRWGSQASGVPPAGPMDLVSHRWANHLVGNSGDAATLEVTLLGPEIEFLTEATAAVTGATFELAVDGTPVAMHTRFSVARGGRLRFGARQKGARAYLAVRGGFDVPIVLGSRSTHLVSRTGGVAGRPLKAGDILPLGTPEPGRTGTGAGLPPLMPEGGATLRVLPGPHGSRFGTSAEATLVTSRYTISAQSNRMAYRLEGPPLAREPVGELLSDFTPMGAIQVPPSGVPILLMADRGTTGGYPLIACVISADLSRAGQLAPGDWVEFTIASHRDAMRALIAQERALLAS